MPGSWCGACSPSPTTGARGEENRPRGDTGGPGGSVCGRRRFQEPNEFLTPPTSPWESRSDTRVGSDAAPTEAPPRPMLLVYLTTSLNGRDSQGGRCEIDLDPRPRVSCQDLGNTLDPLLHNSSTLDKLRLY